MSSKTRSPAKVVLMSAMRRHQPPVPTVGTMIDGISAEVEAVMRRHMDEIARAYDKRIKPEVLLDLAVEGAMAGMVAAGATADAIRRHIEPEGGTP